MPKDQELDARSPGWRPDLRGVLVIGQVSLSLVLLIGGGLSLKSLLNARALDVGLARDHRLLISLDPGLPG
jgi:hypothetical protein